MKQIVTKIQVKGLRLRGYHGVGAQETRVGNIFSYDVEVELPWIDAADSDDIDLTLSYADIVAVVKAVNATPSNLLEHVAARLYRTLCSHFPQITGGMVKVAKLTPPIACSEMDEAAVTISW